VVRVLIVDDDQPVRGFLRAALENDGFAIEEAGDADAARQILARGNTDVVVCDIVLPSSSGIQLLTEIKRTMPQTQVVMLTGQPTLETATDALRLGAFDYLSKPVIRPAIVRAVSNAAKVKAIDDERLRLEELNAQNMAQLRQQNEELHLAQIFREEVEHITRHDLKGPLNIVIALPDVMAEMGRNLTREQRRDLGMIRDAGRKMLSMINSSLDMFRLERGMYKLKPGQVDLAALVREVIEHLGSLADVKKLHVRTLVDGRDLRTDETFLVSGEKLLLYSMVTNLMKNAMEASPEGGDVAVFLERNGGTTLRIRNRGAVPVEVRDRMFSKFATFGKTGGTGLGCYSAKLVAQAHGATIGLQEDDPGCTSIAIRFPGPDPTPTPSA
jgi:signal transduction histidine kinase